MDKIRITDLAEIMIEKTAPRYGFKPEDIKIKIIGTRPGEKIDEHLVTEEEKEHLIDLRELSVLRPPKTLIFSKKRHLKIKPQKKIDIDNGRLLSKDEVRILLHKFNLGG